MTKLLLVECGAGDTFMMPVSNDIAEVFINDPTLKVTVVRESGEE